MCTPTHLCRLPFRASANPPLSHRLLWCGPSWQLRWGLFTLSCRFMTVTHTHTHIHTHTHTHIHTHTHTHTHTQTGAVEDVLECVTHLVKADVPALALNTLLRKLRCSEIAPDVAQYLQTRQESEFVQMCAEVRRCHSPTLLRVQFRSTAAKLHSRLDLQC
jgi:hypothetical protein